MYACKMLLASPLPSIEHTAVHRLSGSWDLIMDLPLPIRCHALWMLDRIDLFWASHPKVQGPKEGAQAQDFGSQLCTGDQKKLSGTPQTFTCSRFVTFLFSIAETGVSTFFHATLYAVHHASIASFGHLASRCYKAPLGLWLGTWDSSLGRLSSAVTRVFQ